MEECTIVAIEENKLMLNIVNSQTSSIKCHTTQHRFCAGDVVWAIHYDKVVTTDKLFGRKIDSFQFVPKEGIVKEMVNDGSVKYRVKGYSNYFLEDMVGATEAEAMLKCRALNH